jgi:hypothetical protein
MKPLVKLALAGVLLASVSSCSSFLDINQNPNSPLTATPNTILAQALAVTASNYTGGGTNFNTYGSWTAGFWGKSGTVNGYGTERTYNYTTNFYQGLWTNTYNNLEDYKLIQDQAAGYGRHAAIARIMKVYNFLLLVDQYGDIPYFTALKGLSGSLTPTYDSAPLIYRDFVTQLDGAITDINTAVADQRQIAVGTEDIVFQGNMTNWKRFANTLKLRILMRQSQTNDAALNTYVQAQLNTLRTAADGFITADVVAQPGYLQTAGKQNPFFDRYGVNPAGTSFTAEYSYQLPTRWILEQYVGKRDSRAVQMYATATTSQPDGSPRPRAEWTYTLNYLGTTVSGDSYPYIGADLGEPSPVVGNRSSRFRNGGALLKGFDAPTPLFLMSEYYFLRAEAETRNLGGFTDASAKADYEAGVRASFVYFYTPAPSRRSTATDSSAFVTTPVYTPTANEIATLTPAQLATRIRLNSGKVARYFAINSTNPLVNYDLATTNGALGKQAIIIYQKYLAMNTVGSIEAWADYRRTGLPKFRVSYEGSLASRIDRLPTRLLYPQVEVATNAGNIPTVTNTTKIFWDVIDMPNP